MNFSTLILSTIFLLAAAGWCSAENSLNNLSAGKMSLSFSPKSGFSLSYNGVSIIKESTLWVHDPSWTKHYYGYPEGRIDITTRDISGGKEALIKHSTPSFEGQHHATVLENKLILEFKYKLTADVDGEMEYNIGYVSASPIMGCRFRSVTEDGEYAETVPLAARHPDTFKSMLTPKPFKSLSIDSRIGKLTLEVTGDPNVLSIFDARKNRQPWAERNPVFWCGTLGKKLEPGREYTQTVTISIDPGLAREKPVNVGRGDAIFPQDVDNLRVPCSSSSIIIPEPKEMKLLGADFPLNKDTKIVVADGAAPEDLRGARLFAQEIRELYNLDLEIVKESKAPGSKGVILVGEAARNKMLAAVAKADGISAPEHEEGYAIKSTPDRVMVLGTDQRGSYWGMQSLRQLIKANETGPAVQGCTVNDWPSLKFRAAHLFVGNRALDFHKKLYDRIFSRYKLNAIILECEYMQWKSAPEIARNWAMTQEDFVKDVEAAREHFMEVIPMVNTLGHSEWMFHSLGSKEWKNLHLAEDPTHPYAYCPSNPETYKFIFRIYDEVLNLVKPKYIHIGHDEVGNEGEFPKCDKCKTKSAGDLVVGDILKLHDYFSKKGVQIMMWGDMFLAKGESPDACNAGSLEEAKRRRSMLPKDIIFTDWHYAPADPEEFRSLKILADEGFQCISSTWYTPANIANFAKAAKDNNSMGLLQTTWAGFDSNEDNLKASYNQFTAFILAADYAWNSSTTALEDLEYRPDDEFRRQWDRIPPDCKTRKGFIIDITPSCNVMLADNMERTGWVGFGPEMDLSSVPTGEVRLKGDLFKLASNNSDLSVLRLSSALDFEIDHPKQAQFPVLRKADSLIFLQTCAWPDSPGRVVGSYRIYYADSSVEEIRIIYGENTAAWSDMRTCVNAPTAWSGHTKSGQRISLRKFEWKNPKPDVLISRVEFASTGAEAGPCLLAVSGIAAGQ